MTRQAQKLTYIAQAMGFSNAIIERRKGRWLIIFVGERHAIDLGRGALDAMDRLCELHKEKRWAEERQ